MATQSRRKRATGIHYSRTRSMTWLGCGQAPVDCNVSGRPGLIGDPIRIEGLPKRSRPRTSVENGIRSAIKAAGFRVPDHVLVDVFANTKIKGMTGPLDLAMVIMALSASKQIQPVDWPTLIVGYVNPDGGFTPVSDDLAFAVYGKARELDSYQLICPARLLEQMPVNAQLTHRPIGLTHLRDLTSHLVFTEQLG